MHAELRAAHCEALRRSAVYPALQKLSEGWEGGHLQTHTRMAFDTLQKTCIWISPSCSGCSRHTLTLASLAVLPPSQQHTPCLSLQGDLHAPRTMCPHVPARCKHVPTCACQVQACASMCPPGVSMCPHVPARCKHGAAARSTTLLVPPPHMQITRELSADGIAQRHPRRTARACIDRTAPWGLGADFHVTCSAST